MIVTVPAGVSPGMQLQVQTPSGQPVLVTVPQGKFVLHYGLLLYAYIIYEYIINTFYP